MALWSGRFERSVSEFTQEFGASLPFEKALYKQDVAGSRAHARMLAAQDLLRNTDMPISRIADACGFYDASYFIGQYREFYGETPREWRENNGETTA